MVGNGAPSQSAFFRVFRGPSIVAPPAFQKFYPEKFEHTLDGSVEILKNRRETLDTHTDKQPTLIAVAGADSH